MQKKTLLYITLCISVSVDTVCVSCDCRFSSRMRRRTDFFKLVGEGGEEESAGKGKGRSKKVPSKALLVVRKLSFESHTEPPALIATPPDVLTLQNNCGPKEDDVGPVTIMESQVCKEDHAMVTYLYKHRLV